MSLVLVFSKIMDMSISAIYIILFILLVRGCMFKLPKKYSYVLWLIVGIRLVCPAVISLPFSPVYLDGINQTIITDYVKSDIGKDRNGLNENKNVIKEEKKETENETNSENDLITKSEAIKEMDSQSKVKKDKIQNNKEKNNVKEKDIEIKNSKNAEENQIKRNIETKENLYFQVKQCILSTSEKIFSVNNMKIFTIIWLTGILVMLIWNICLVLWTKGKLEKAVYDTDNIYESDVILSPFVWGFIKPRIYIPFRMEAEERSFILSHEKYHIKRKDYIVKLVAFLITSVYWFHPLVWLAYYCMVQDMEMSCDEQVLLNMKEDARGKYSKLLFAFATNRRNLSPGMLTFGESNTRKRIKHVLDFKKPVKWIGVAGILLVVIVAVLCLTNGRENDLKKKEANNRNETEEYDEAIYGKIDRQEETITLTVYDELSGFSGMQEGWMADVLLEKFNVELNIVSGGNDDILINEFSEGNKADIVLFAFEETYRDALLKGQLYNWEKEDLLDVYGTYMKNNLSDDISYNREQNREFITLEKESKIQQGVYGIRSNCSLVEQDKGMILHTWDIRWDLYKQLGYPEIKNLEDLYQVLKDMQNLQPLDDNGKKAYAASLWKGLFSDQNHMIGGIGETISAYYGFVEDNTSLYNSNISLHKLEKAGPYQQILQWYNKLYREGLLDPDSKKLEFEDMEYKMKNGSILFSPVNYMGSAMYNTEAHLKEGKMMVSVKPEEAVPIEYEVDGVSPIVFGIGGDSKYPQKAMEIINYMATPEGMLTILYGPKGVTWDYDEEGYTYLTELGQKVNEDGETKLGNDYEGSFNDGRLKITNYVLSADSTNPESNGDRFRSNMWKFNYEDVSDVMKDWQEKMGFYSEQKYLEAGTSVLIPNELEYSENSNSTEGNIEEKNKMINEYSWKAIYAESEEEFWKIMDQMRRNVEW